MLLLKVLCWQGNRSVGSRSEEKPGNGQHPTFIHTYHQKITLLAGDPPPLFNSLFYLKITRYSCTRDRKTFDLVIQVYN